MIHFGPFLNIFVLSIINYVIVENLENHKNIKEEKES